MLQEMARLDDDTSRTKVADNCHKKEDGVPDFTIALMFLEIAYQEQTETKPEGECREDQPLP